MEFHPDLEVLAFLVGQWQGGGHGDYPTIEAFDYLEEVEISPLPGKPFLWYRQKTKHAISGDPLHSETGYFRPTGEGNVEFALAQPTGLVEVHAGIIEGTSISLHSSLVGRTATAVDVSDVERLIRVEDSRLTYRMSMAAVGQPFQLHLSAALDRVG